MNKTVEDELNRLSLEVSERFCKLGEDLAEILVKQGFKKEDAMNVVLSSLCNTIGFFTFAYNSENRNIDKVMDHVNKQVRFFFNYAKETAREGREKEKEKITKH